MSADEVVAGELENMQHVSARAVSREIPDLIPANRIIIDWVAVVLLGIAVLGGLLLIFVGVRRSDPTGPLDSPFMWWLSMLLFFGGFIAAVARITWRLEK